MKLRKRDLRAGLAAVLCAAVFCLGAAGAFRPLANLLQNADVVSFLIYLETGRKVRFSPSLEKDANHVGESPPAMPPVNWTVPVFSPSDAQAVKIYNTSGKSADLERLLTQPLDWDLTGSSPTVLIIHTHATESYTKQHEDYRESSAFRTLDEKYNMISIGDQVARILSENGIPVLHDRDLHDYPSYDGSYASSRSAVNEYLARYPSIRLVLDLHRDASGDLNNQFRPVVQVDGQSVAQLMLVMGCGHEAWQDNLSLGLKIQVLLERSVPGITRPLCMRSQQFNQDLTPGALLIEMGAAGNTHDEALRAAQQLAYAIVALSKGSETDT